MKKSIWVLFALMLLLSGCQQQEKRSIDVWIIEVQF